MGGELELPECEERQVAALYSRTDLLKAFSEFFTDVCPRIGFAEDFFWMNIRIILCMICCGFGCYAQFVLKFPKDKFMMALCVVGYFAFSGILALIDLLVVKSAVTCIKINGDSVFVDVNMPMFSSEVTVSLRSGSRSIDHKSDVGKFFSSDGVLSDEALFKQFAALVKQWQTKGSKEAKGGKQH
eukprot:TRINITY_DN8548_c2_g1_i1.p1 TRINITY_DN8548_c2_g1~~TRINITY_DN8548_c2_g1_i1.p1  ORF type:complete len:185 (-),score=24.21 TRINITY_DN8548_c2_g1_i1:178-732(-)